LGLRYEEITKTGNHVRYGPFSEGLATGYVVCADPAHQRAALSLRFKVINLKRSNPLFKNTDS
jgi:hypothetical protein